MYIYYICIYIYPYIFIYIHNSCMSKHWSKSYSAIYRNQESTAHICKDLIYHSS